MCNSHAVKLHNLCQKLNMRIEQIVLMNILGDCEVTCSYSSAKCHEVGWVLDY